MSVLWNYINSINSILIFFNNSAAVPGSEPPGPLWQVDRWDSHVLAGPHPVPGQTGNTSSAESTAIKCGGCGAATSFGRLRLHTLKFLILKPEKKNHFYTNLYKSNCLYKLIWWLIQIQDFFCLPKRWSRRRLKKAAFGSDRQKLWLRLLLNWNIRLPEFLQGKRLLYIWLI